MFCQNCGHELKDHANFCAHCGAKVNGFKKPLRTPGKKKSKAPLAVVLIIIAVLIVAGVGGTAYASSRLSSQKKILENKISQAGIEEYISAGESAAEGWNGLGFFDFSKKKAIISELQSVLNDVTAVMNEKTAVYEAVDMSSAEESEVNSYKEHLETIQKLIADEDYASIQTAFDEMDEIVNPYIEPENPLDITIQQVDASEFPKVKLYLNIQDPASGAVPEGLESTLFYLRKEDANGSFVKKTISKISQLNETEALNIDMVADVSGSMDGAPMAQAKSIMSNFINSVQFSSGDMVELTSFSTGVRLEEQFCNDASVLINDINNLYTDDMTSLYDALYTAVERVASQSGAKCVIAFTDGLDNYSSCSASDVIEVANRYHVPVFIIGIGTMDYSTVGNIASQTGGAYYNVYDVNSMLDIYDEIYRMEKEMYLVEFEDGSEAKITDTANIEIGYNSITYGGRCTYSYTPNVLMNVNGTTLYTDGPEAVVEKYIKGFDDAMTMSDFSYISDCLKTDSNIYKTQKEYIKKGISERLDSCEIIDVDYSSKTKCVVTTRETYYVQTKSTSLQLMTQQCQYKVEKVGDDWKMTDFAGKVEVLSRINQ